MCVASSRRDVLVVGKLRVFRPLVLPSSSTFGISIYEEHLPFACCPDVDWCDMVARAHLGSIGSWCASTHMFSFLRSNVHFAFHDFTLRFRWYLYFRSHSDTPGVTAFCSLTVLRCIRVSVARADTAGVLVPTDSYLTGNPSSLHDKHGGISHRGN